MINAYSKLEEKTDECAKLVITTTESKKAISFSCLYRKYQKVFSTLI